MAGDGKSNGTSTSEVRFMDRHEPGIPSGTYRLSVTQELTIPLTSTTRKFELTRTFVVDGPRSALKPAEIAAVYPPDGSLGDHRAVLPHIVLCRSTLPWERVACDKRFDCPWLALLLFEDKEKPVPIPIDPESPQKPPVEGKATASAIDVPPDLLGSLLPDTIDELQYLVHVRSTRTTVRKVIEEDPSQGEVSVVLGNRLPVEGGTSTVHLVSVEGCYDDSGKRNLRTSDGRDFVRLISLKSWSFSCPPKSGGFAERLKALNRTPATLRLPAVGRADADLCLAGGASPLPHALRRDWKTVSWYHGPLAPAASTDELPDRVLAADALLRYDPATGMFDASYAAAWGLGRLLTLRSKAASTGLFLWKRAAAQRLRRRGLLKGLALPIKSPPDGATEPPLVVKEWFDDLRALKNVPFSYLVPDERMLPIESIRVFCIDRVWITSLLDGAASIGRVSQEELGRDKVLFQDLARPMDGIWSGILLRSSVVSGWPGLLVDAFDANGKPCPPVRIDRLSSSILLAIFEGQLDRIAIHLQPELLHFGFDVPDGSDSGSGQPVFYKKLRKADGHKHDSVRVDPIPWRQAPGSPTAARVFSATRMADAMRNAYAGKPEDDPFRDAQPNPAQFALQMIEGVPRVEFWRKEPPKPNPSDSSPRRRGPDPGRGVRLT